MGSCRLGRNSDATACLPGCLAADSLHLNVLDPEGQLLLVPSPLSCGHR